MRSPPRVLERWVSLGHPIAQVFALVVGCWWAYTRFIQTEAPAQRQNFTTDQQMKWADAPVPSVCYAILSVTFENISRSEVPIKKVVRRAWMLPLPSLDKPIAYVDPEQLTNTSATDSASYTAGPFVQQYPPKARVQYDLTWTLQRVPGLAVFRVDLYAEPQDTEPTDWIYEWDEICGGRSGG